MTNILYTPSKPIKDFFRSLADLNGASINGTQYSISIYKENSIYIITIEDGYPLKRNSIIRFQCKYNSSSTENTLSFKGGLVWFNQIMFLLLSITLFVASFYMAELAICYFSISILFAFVFIKSLLSARKNISKIFDLLEFVDKS